MLERAVNLLAGASFISFGLAVRSGLTFTFTHRFNEFESFICGSQLGREMDFVADVALTSKSLATMASRRYA